MSVTISLAFDSAKSGSILPGTIQGGLQITVQGEELTRIVGQDELNTAAEKELPGKPWWYDYQGTELDAGRYAFKGDYIEVILSVVVEKLEDFGTGETNRHEKVTVDLGKSDYVLVFSYVDSTHDVVRLAFQGKEVGTNGSPTVDNAVGCPVPFDELYYEFARCLREYVEHARRSGFDPADWEVLDEYEAKADRFEELADR